MRSLDIAQNIKHFSHPHELQLFNNNNNTSCFQNSTLCSCCKLPISGNVYACIPCNFVLHPACVQIPLLTTHFSHPNHTLVLLPTSSYHGGIFICDACNSPGNGFSYHCSTCEYDLHVVCASKPLKITVEFHSCPLELTFKNPYDNAKGFHCDVCRKIESKQWLYRCSTCEFDVHLDCITTTDPTPVNHGQVHSLQQHHSFSGEIVRDQNLKPNQHMPSASISTVPDRGQFPENPVTSSNSGQHFHFAHSASAGSIQKMVQKTGSNNLMNVVGRGIIEGESQKVSQNLVDGGEDGSSFSSSVFGDFSDKAQYNTQYLNFNPV